MELESITTLGLARHERPRQLARRARGEHTVPQERAGSGTLRVAFVVTRADSFGGASVHVRDFSRLLIASGHEAMVFIGGEGPVVEALRQASVPVCILRHLGRAIRPVADLRALWELGGALDRYRPHIVSTHTSKAGFIGRLAAWGMGFPVVYTPHCWSFVDGFPNAKLYLWAERLARPFGRRIVMVSDAERQEGLRGHVGSTRHLVTVHNGMPDIATEFRASPGLTPPRLTMIGRCEPQKDHRTLLRALARVKDLEWSLDFVGDGPLRAHVESESWQLGLGSRVRFLGYRSDVAAILSQSQIFALITNWESFPRSIIEAMRAGLPVVATAVGGAAESVAHGSTGFVVPRGDVAALAARLRELIAQRDLRIAFGAAGRRRYEENFTLAHMVRKTAAVWADVLGRPVAIKCGD